MMPSITTPKSALAEFVRLQLELHKLFQVGRQDSNEADNVRSEMEHYWWQLSEREQALMEGLSADLFTIGGAREINKIESPFTANNLQRIVETGDWPKVLESIRDHEASFPPFAAAYLRGVAWMHLDFPEVALEFFAEMNRHEKPDPAQEIWQLQCQILAGRLSQAIPRALEIASSEQNPLLLMKASHILSLAGEKAKGDKQMELLRLAIQTAEQSLASLQDLPLSVGDAERDLLEIQQVATLLHLAQDYALQGEAQLAQQACQRALNIDPSNVDARVLLGWLVHDSNRQRANEIFFEGFSGRLSLNARGLPTMASPTWSTELFSHS